MNHSDNRFYREKSSQPPNWINGAAVAIQEYLQFPVSAIGTIEHLIERFAPAVEQDKSMLDWLQAKAEEGFVSMCFEVDGGVHVTLEPLGGSMSAARNKNTIRDAIGELMKRSERRTIDMSIAERQHAYRPSPGNAEICELCFDGRDDPKHIVQLIERCPDCGHDFKNSNEITRAALYDCRVRPYVNQGDPTICGCDNDFHRRTGKSK